MIDLPKEQFVAVWEVYGQPISMTFGWYCDILVAYNPFTGKWTYDHGMTPALLTKLKATSILGTK